MDRSRLDSAMERSRVSHDRLMQTLRGLTDDRASGPSLLPGWSRGHVLTHLARNADSHVRLLRAAERGEHVEQYVGGTEGRAAAIEAGAGRPAQELGADVNKAARALFEVWAKISDRTWDEEVVAIHGEQPASACVFSRWRETEIHHVDLDLGYTIEDWPLDFVEATLPDLVETLESRLPENHALDISATDLEFVASAGPADGERTGVEVPARVLLAWLVGRGVPRAHRSSLPQLTAWI